MKTLLISILCVSSLYSIQAQSQQITKLVVGTEPAFAPFEYVDEKSGELKGFDIEIMNAIGKTLNIEIKWVPLPFDGIVPGVVSGTLDAAISGLVKNPERQKRVAFTNDYYVVGQSIMVKKENKEITGFDSLENKRICVQIGTVGADKANATKGAKVFTYNSAPEAYLELNKGGCEAFITGRTVHQFYLAQERNSDFKLLDEIYEAQGLGIAVNKNNTEVLNLLDDGILKIKENGMYDDIYNKWFKSE